MSRLEELHPDQQAVLQLVLRRKLAYADVAGALGLDAALVRERSLDAVDGLAPDDVPGLEPEDRDRIADYLLGQQPASDRQATRDLLEQQAPARTWARLVAAELRPLAGDELPAVPGDGEDVREAFAALDARTVAEGRDRQRRGAGTILLLVAGALVTAAIVLWVTGVFDGGDDAGDSTASTPTATSTTDAAPNYTQLPSGMLQTVVLNAPGGGKSSPKAAAQLQVADGQIVATLAGERFKPLKSSRRLTYAVWLTGGGQQAVRLGWFSNGEKDPSTGKATTKTINAKGQITGTVIPLMVGKDIQGNSEFRIDPAKYTTMVIAEETEQTLKGNEPGKTIVRGAIKR
ncbi:hypothetical protein [Patulibacter defluvii]|uniref:hypothetical protein n=1 Tax=Patulibacter defluvii TaxID=3095358 RepID=UPI002A75058A|nr:hypothetical protein [Patulibacter sp. DM4]